ncbi:MAG: bifunctional acetate--CoA ligase family protein/GNAT family N-acetyltransferase [Afipia sp.]
MSTYRLEHLFAPRSIALVGGSPKPASVGGTTLRNLLAGGFNGPIYVVNPKHSEIEGIKTLRDIKDVPGTPDLTIISTPPSLIQGIVKSAGARGFPAAMVLSAGLGLGTGSYTEAIAQTARKTGLRLIGPALGVLIPRIKLNASFASRLPQMGDLALISQSGAISTALGEWAANRNVGFSAIVSTGENLDIDFGDLLDYFALDTDTRAILLYIESISDVRKFMSAARAAARVKPVVVIKSGRHTQGARAAATHTGALAGSDAVYDAAFRRAGLLRVLDLDELFSAAETLGHLQSSHGHRLAIVTNGGGLGVLAVDRLIDLGGELAGLSEDVKKSLDKVLPERWSHANPVDILGDADGERYAQACERVLGDTANNALLVMNAPNTLASSVESAKSVVAAVKKYRTEMYSRKPVFTAWVGDNGGAAAVFGEAGIPHFPSEADAVRGFMHIVRYREGLDVAMQTPPSLPEDFAPDVTAGRAIIQSALKDKRGWLNPLEINELFAAYAIPIASAALARDPDQAARAATPILAAGSTVVVKISSPDILNKSDVGGVRLNLTSERAVHDATDEILQRARKMRPKARIDGVTVHPMILRPRARELIAGLADDPTFGPVVVFGRGGTAVEVINDKALALPPLDLNLARDLIARTRVSRILKSYRDVPAADEGAVALLLVKLAQMAADLPEIRELDINPLLADKDGVIAVDAQVSIAPLSEAIRGSGHYRFAIRPYPKEWERHLKLKDGRGTFVRPVRPEDEHLYPEFFEHVSREDVRLRFFSAMKELSHPFIARLTQLDYARAMAFIAIEETTGKMLGVVRLHTDADFASAEYAILIRTDLKGIGLGSMLMKMIIEYGRAEGVRAIRGQVLSRNTVMLDMCRRLGFEIRPDPQNSDISLVELPLAKQA